ncbi:MAG: hypothetical protein JJE44_09170 [Flavobacteriaceae bacterium]|nr:hypothetical protein [Flavobacteriaceae bacterium]
MKKFILFIAIVFITMTSKAQINEVGLFVGGSNYIGDIGPEYYINPNNIMGGVIYKWNLNPRIAFRGTFTYAQISSDDADATNIARKERFNRGDGLRFTNSIKELAVGVEFNYFEYNLGDYRKTKTPYLLVEFAAFNYEVVSDKTPTPPYQYESKIAYAIPFGIGYKTKLVNNFSIALEIRARYTFVDDIDYNNQDIELLKFGNPNSNDWYMLTGISLVYSFGRPPCYATPY